MVMLAWKSVASLSLVALLSAASLSAAEPVASSANQRLADAVALELKNSGIAWKYKLDVSCVRGIVALDGTVSDPHQRQEAARIVRKVPGVENVVNRLQVAGAASIQRTSYDKPIELPPPMLTGPAPVVPPEPVPSFRAGLPMEGMNEPPPMPTNAWPTYAPYNNYSRVAYPQSYPYNAFPHIGPFYPYPKVPLGWRCVKLEWSDGHWWLSTHGQQHDRWVVRFW
jgi:hypothetical protein